MFWFVCVCGGGGFCYGEVEGGKDMSSKGGFRELFLGIIKGFWVGRG